MTNDVALQDKKDSLAEYLNSPAVSQNIESVIGDRKNQFVTSVVSLVSTNDNLKDVDRSTLLSACITAASLDLPINSNLGFAYVIPYKNKEGEKLAQFQMGYKGFIQLAMRSGQFKTINVTDVREGEIVSNNRLTGEIVFEWVQDDREKLPVVGYVAYMSLVNGFEKSLYMTRKELDSHGMRFSKTMKKGYGLWKDDFDSMAKKTVVKLLLSKYAPLTVDMQTAQLADQAIVRSDRYEYIDNSPIDPHEVADEKEQIRVRTHILDAKTVKDLKKVEKYIVDDQTDFMYQTKLEELEGKNE